MRSPCLRALAYALGVAVLCLLDVGPVHAGALPTRVRVLGEDGLPRRDAVLVAATAGTPPLVDLHSEIVARADAQGWIQVPANPLTPLAVRAAETAPALLSAGDQDIVTVRLLRAVAISGNVRLASKEPGTRPTPLEVLALPTELGELGQRTVAAEDGSYRFTSLHDGVWLLAVRRHAKDRLVSLGAVRAGSSAGERIVLPGGAFAGAIADADHTETPAVGVPFRLVSVNSGSDAPPLHASTDAEGRFAFAAVPPGAYEARLEDPSWAFDGPTPRVVVSVRDAPPAVQWFVMRCPSVSGTVLTGDKAPIRGAQVRLMPPFGDRGPKQKLTVETNEQGQFRIPHVRPDDGYRFLITAPGYGPWIGNPFLVRRVEDTTRDPMRLDKGWLLDVLVRDESGKPVADADLRVAPATRPNIEPGSPWTVLARRGTTKVDGHARMADLPIDDVFLTVHSEGSLSQRVLVPYPRTEDSGSVDITLHPAAVLSGTITTTESTPAGADKPVYRIEVRDRDRGDVQTVDTGENGEFRVAGLRDVAHDIAVYRPPNLLLVRVESVFPRVDTDLVIPVPDLHTVEGEVLGLDETGPAPSVQLEAPRFDRDLERYVWIPERTELVARGGRQGTFRIENVRPGAYALRVLQSGRATALIEILVVDTTVGGLTLRMEDGARLAGLVYGEDSKPRAALRVTAEPLRGDGDVRAPSASALEAFTDDDGAFVFAALAPGLWRTTVYSESHAPRSAVVRLRAGESVVLDDFEMRDGVHLRGRVRSTDGRALEGVRIAVRRIDGSGRAQTALTDADGDYDVPFLAPGVYLARVEGVDPQFLPADEAAIEIGDEDVSLDFEPSEGATLTALVARAGDPVSGALVELIAVPSDEESPVLAVRSQSPSDDEGRVVFSDLRPGDYTLALTVGALRTERSVFLEAHDEIELDLPAYEGRLRGRVFGPSGNPVTGAYIEARSREDPNVVAQARSNGEGRFILAGVPITEFDVLVTAAGLPPGRLSSAHAELTGSDFPYDIHLGHGGDLTVEVVDAMERPVADAQVRLTSVDGVALHRWPFTSDPDGKVTVRGLPPGPVVVRVHAHGSGSPAPVTVQIADGAVTEQRISLVAPGSLRIVVASTTLDPVPRVHVEVLHAPSMALAARRRPLRRLSAQEAGRLMPRAGTVTFQDLEPGSYVVRVHAGGRFTSVERKVDIVVGVVTQVGVQLAPK